MGVWDFFAPALCPLVEGVRLEPLSDRLGPLFDAFAPITPAGLDLQLYGLILPLTAMFGAIFVGSYFLWGFIGITGPESYVQTPTPLVLQKFSHHPEPVGYCRALFASACMSMLHGGSTTILAGAEAYFAADMFFYMIPFINHTDALFIVHHCFTSGYMLWALNIGQGAISSLMLMFLGEITSVFFNPWLCARDWKKATKNGSKTAATIFELFTYPYSLLFIFIRGIAAPPVLINMCRGLLASTTLSEATKYTWVFAITASYLGSLIWVKKLTLGFGKFMYKKITGSKKSSKSD